MSNRIEVVCRIRVYKINGKEADLETQLVVSDHLTGMVNIRTPDGMEFMVYGHDLQTAVTNALNAS